MGREGAHGFAVGHGGSAALQAGEDERLGHLGEGDFGVHPRGGGAECGDAGHGFGGDADLGAEVALLLRGAVDVWVAGVDARDEQPLVAGFRVERHEVFQRNRRGVDHFRALLVAGDDARVHERGGPDDDVRLRDDAGAAQGDEVVGARPRAHEHHEPLGWVKA